MQKTYLFYDLETSGLNKSFDQVMQFAAIRTDENLNELERYNILVKLNPDVIPSPYAVITHHIGIDDIKNGLSEYEAIKKIHVLMNQPGTISLGYNTLGFDDEFLRFSFYRNLLPAYTHQYANQCSRMDLYPMSSIYFNYKPDVIAWPKLEGRSTLKLEYLSAENKLAEGLAHDAMVDVDATVALAKRFKQEKEMWDYLCGYFDKNIDLERISNLTPSLMSSSGQHRQGILMDGINGADNRYASLVLSLGKHHVYKNQLLFLRLDQPVLREVTEKNIPELFLVIKKKIGETGFLLPTNERFLKIVPEEKINIMEENKKWLQKHDYLLQEIIRYYANYTYPIVPNIDIDAALYQNGFMSPEDEMMCRQFQQVDLNQKITLLDEVFNSNLKKQMIRIIARNYPNALPEKYQVEYEEYLNLIKKSSDSIIDYKNNSKLTPEKALEEIEELKDKNLGSDERRLLAELEQYILGLKVE